MRTQGWAGQEGWRSTLLKNHEDLIPRQSGPSGRTACVCVYVYASAWEWNTGKPQVLHWVPDLALEPKEARTMSLWPSEALAEGEEA